MPGKDNGILAFISFIIYILTHPRNRPATYNSERGKLRECEKTKQTTQLGTFLPDSLTYPTYSYKGEWSKIDAFFLSPQLLDSTGWHCHPYHWNYSFLLEKDLEYGGYKPRRTRKGIAFRSGYSDHLPIGLLLKYR
ncbi:MAG: endonuclease/exonuclease/phosphatase family protein [Bacteroides sp.]